MTSSRFAEEHSLPFPVLSDSETQVTKAYGARTSYPQFNLFNIARRYENVKAEGHSKMVLAELASLQQPKK